MSRKANCYDNASIESFWATLKAECFGSFLPPSRATAHAMIFDYIETFDNPCLSGCLTNQSEVMLSGVPSRAQAADGTESKHPV